jgi:hypothetical protein
MRKEDLKSEINTLKLLELYFETLPQLIHMCYIYLNSNENSMSARFIIGILSASISFTLLLGNTFKFYNVNFDYIFQSSRSVFNLILLLQRILALVGAFIYHPVIVLIFLVLRFFITCLSVVYFFRKLKIDYNLVEITIGIIHEKYVYALRIVSFVYVYFETMIFFYLFLNKKISPVHFLTNKLYPNSTFILDSKIHSDQGLNIYFILANVFISGCCSSSMWLVYLIDNKMNSKKVSKLVLSEVEIQRKSIFLFIIPTDRILFQTSISNQNIQEKKTNH